MNEVWRDIAGYEGRYQVSNLGRVKSLPNSRRKSEMILKLQTHRSGYLLVNLTSNDGGRWRQKSFWLARLVCTEFHGSPLPGEEARHLDGCPTNNSETNLCWGTHQENEDDKRRHGTSNLGARNPRAILNEVVVREIKRELSLGRDLSSLAAEYGVSRNTVKSIRNGDNWSHV